MAAYLFDKGAQQVGELMGKDAGGYLLRPVGSGQVWRCLPEHARATTAVERMRAGVPTLRERR